MSTPVNIVIVGNGFGGTYTLKRLHKIFRNHAHIKLTLIGEKNYFLFTPLLHEVATGSLNPENIIEPIRKLFGCRLDTFYLGTVERVDTKNQTVTINSSSKHHPESETISYDYLVLAHGSQTNFYNIMGAAEHSFTLKSLEDAIKIKNHVITQMERASRTEDDMLRQQMLHFTVVGGGPSGVEVAAELRELIVETFSHYYTRALIKDTHVTVIQKGKDLLPQFPMSIRKKSLTTLRKKGIEVLLDTEVKEVGPTHTILSNDTALTSETIIWVAGVEPQKLHFDAPIPLTPDGKIIVNEYLQIENYKNIFALGDGAACKMNGVFLPALAQVAVKQARHVAHNIKHSINKKKLEPFTYRSNGSLVSLGQWMAVGEIAHFTFAGHLAWWLWRTVYLSKMISMRKKIKVAIDWTINLFSPRDISHI